MLSASINGIHVWPLQYRGKVLFLDKKEATHGKTESEWGRSRKGKTRILDSFDMTVCRDLKQVYKNRLLFSHLPLDTLFYVLIQKHTQTHTYGSDILLVWSVIYPLLRRPVWCHTYTLGLSPVPGLWLFLCFIKPDIYLCSATGCCSPFSFI